MINKILALLFVLSVAVGLSVLVMIYGWGLTPVSWWWIIGVGVFGQVFMKMVGDKIIKSDD